MPRDDRDIRDHKERCAASDREMAGRHAAFDLGSQDQHMKYERAHFAVVGEGTKSANEAYRAGWERIFGLQAQSEGEKDT